MCYLLLYKGLTYFLVFLLIIGGYYCDIKVSIDLKGSYDIFISNRIWLRSSYTSLYSNNRWYSTSDGSSLCLICKYLSRGNDSKLGEWNETELIYNYNLNEKLNNVTGRIRQWKSIPEIAFYFDSGTIDLNNDILLDMDRVRTVFPSFYIEKLGKDDHRSYLTFGGMMMGDLEKHAGIWNSKSRFIKCGLSGGPLIVFNSTFNGHGDAIIISPFSQFMSTSLSIDQNILEYGFMGSIRSIPKNSSNSLIIFYSSSRINQLVDQWGKTMQNVYSKSNQSRLNDLTINYLGYYTDNGGYYYK